MKEDIKNLEEIINLCKEEINNNDKNITATLDLEDLNSLKNLLTGYKQIEEKLKIKTGDVDYLTNKINRHFIDDVTLKQDYIPKSKVKEKIEEINNENLNYSESEYYLESEIKGYAIEHLQELLGKE